MLTKEKLKSLLKVLREFSIETEWLEFKATSGIDLHKLGCYFSAMSNEARLHNQECGWIIMGIHDKTHEVVGTNYKDTSASLDKLKREITQDTTNGIGFQGMYEMFEEGKRVLMFSVPPAPLGMPIAWKNKFYGRDGSSLGDLKQDEIDRIRDLKSIDWSAEIVADAKIDDLDPEAIQKARLNYKRKFQNLESEVDSWDDITFLNKAKVTIKGSITRTSILLLGKSESEHFLNPADIKIRWILKNADGKEKDYEIFSCPFILSVDKVYSKIRNTKYRYLKDGTLFPDEVLTYEPFVIRESINNCIAHQDYQKSGRINVIEKEDGELIFTNYAKFIPKSVEHVLMEDAPEEFYRNQFLATAMFNLNMVDTIGSGIKKMFNFQKERFFPLPEYDLSHGKVKLTITGKVLDVEFARVLARKPMLSLQEIISLDKIQKKKPLSIAEVKSLKQKGLIEGRKPNFYISAHVVSATADGNLKADYIRNRPFDDDHYKKMILDYLQEFGHATRQDINKLLLSKLSDILSADQKKNKINNLIGQLRKDGIVKNKGAKKKPKYLLIK